MVSPTANTLALLTEESLDRPWQTCGWTGNCGSFCSHTAYEPPLFRGCGYCMLICATHREGTMNANVDRVFIITWVGEYCRGMVGMT